MRKESLAAIGILATAAMAASSWADQLIYEPFNYTSGQPISGQVDNTTTNSNGEQWWDAGTIGSTVHQVGSPGLSAPTGFPAATGNMADLKGADDTEFERINIPGAFDSNLQAIYAGGSTLYYSVLLNIPDASAGVGKASNNTNPNENNDTIIAFNNVQGSQAGRPNSWNGELVFRQGSDSTHFNLGIRASTTTAGTTYFTGDLNQGQTYLIVVEASLNADASDGTNSIWVDPDASTFGAASAPTPDGSSNGSGSKNSNIWNMESLLIGAGISSGSNPDDVYLDEIRVGNTWADVTTSATFATVPDPGAAVGGLVLLAGLAGENIRRRRRQA